MHQSEQINEIASALAIAQGSFGIAEENKTGAFKGKYASYESLRSATKKPLSENGLCITHVISMGDKGQVMTTQLSHKSGQWIRSEIFLPTGGKGESTHELGKAITYCKRYSYAAIICVSTGEEDEDANVGSEVTKTEVHEKITYSPEALERIGQKLKESESFKGMLKYYKVSSLKEIPQEKINEAMRAVNSMLKGINMESQNEA